jgi:hypothetical protein
LGDVDEKLGLVEDSLGGQSPAVADQGADIWSKEQIKDLLPRESEDSGDKPAKEAPTRQRRKADQRQFERDDEGPQRAGGRGDSGLVTPAQTSGLNTLGWILLWGIFLAVCVAAIVLAWKNRMPKAKSTKAPQVEPSQPTLEQLLAQPHAQAISELWGQAEDLARQGRFLEAVRSLYLATLAFLHRSNHIRYEPTRTNGEYLDQLRSQSPLQDSFRGLTGIFERKWYGELVCGSGDFTSCRQLAEAIRKSEEPRTKFQEPTTT